ncbi:hypothetical protein CWI37_0057p0020 [Hamiltosporidium tvaerminnensis]|uniref:Uncharacterized protein n=1 Tax=Hamiltosporidium tvaerminnensis TaxID=1176355 RepID=A0A4Q9LDD1_9MICR|nr:hypothetical protein CWI37_0057p0020 [Hamiltosporidium tvaerminnensis]
MAQSFVIIPIFKKNNNFLTEAKQFHLIEEVIFIKNKNRDPKAIGDCKSEAYPRTFEEHYLPNHIRMTEMFSSIAMICMGMFSANQTITRALAKELRNSPVKIWIYMLKKVIYKYNIAQPNVIGCSPIRVPRFRDGFNPRIVAEADKTEIVNNENDGNSDGKFLLQTDFFDKTPDIFILDMRKNKMTVIEVVITYQDSLQTVESKKIRKYDLLANELCLIYKPNAEERVSVTVILRAEMHKQPSLSLKQVYNQEDGVKTENTKNILSLILDGITSAEVPKINANEHSEGLNGGPNYLKKRRKFVNPEFY